MRTIAFTLGLLAVIPFAQAQDDRHPVQTHRSAYERAVPRDEWRATTAPAPTTPPDFGSYSTSHVARTLGF